MIIEETYEDFDDLFLSINWKIAENPETYFDHVVTEHYFFKPFLLTVKNPIATLDFSFLGYSKSKFQKLAFNYIDLDEWEAFKEKLKISRGLSLTFYFNRIKKRKGNNTDASPCILNMVFTRKKRSVKWQEVYVLYRTTEINRAFYLDLFLFSKMLEEVKESCEPEDFIFRTFIPTPFIKVSTSFWVMDALGVELSDENFIKKELLNVRQQCIDRSFSPFRQRKRVQVYVKGLSNYKPIDINSLSLKALKTEEIK